MKKKAKAKAMNMPHITKEINLKVKTLALKKACFISRLDTKAKPARNGGAW
jgi:hypothetical protein